MSARVYKCKNNTISVETIPGIRGRGIKDSGGGGEMYHIWV
jgi:hypothetical protein